MKRIIFTLLMVVSYMLTSHAANIFTISDVQGRPGEEVTVSVSLDNSDAVSAVDMTIPLDRQLTYVDGSCVLNSLRANGHLITAGANNTELRVVIYDLNTNALKGESGELFSFKLLLKKEPQTYTLTATTVLGNATGGNLHSSVEPGSVTIHSPKLTVITTKVDYGHIPIRSTYTQNITIQNSGNERLEVSGVAFSANEFSTDETLFSVEAGDTKDITINYAPVSRGAISETVTFISNAINGKQKATLVADPFSVNELHVGSASGISDEEVTISLTMNNMEPIVGMSCDFTLPEQLVYVDGSFTASSRAGNLLATSQVNGNKLTLVLYSLNSKVIEGNDGEIATFKVRLNGTSGWYELYPEKVVLSNTTAENMTSATSSGVVQIQSPTISCVDELNMGDNPITELSKAPYKIYNYGEATLTISKVTFLAEGYSIAEQLPISIEPWQEQEITIEYKPTAKGRHSTIMQIYSNDPQNRMKSVEVTGSIHEPNNITVEGDFTENGYDLRVSLENYTEVVALQMDIHWIPQVVANEIKPTDRLNGLSTSITPIGNGVYRVILFSLNNTPISGHSGEIFTISYTHDNEVAIDNSVVTFDNMVFSSKNSENMSSQEAFIYTIPARKAQSITLDRTEVTLKANETTTLEVTIKPETTTIKDVVWSSSDESVATVENGVVTAHQVGTATITATTTDGTNLSASCSVEVVATPAESIALDRTEVTLKANETTTLTATILPETATNKDVVWSSNDESVATVENGVVTAHQVGTATITVSTTDGTNLSASCEVTVVATPAESIALDRTEVTLKANETTTLEVTIKPETTTIKDVEWKSSDESVATIENGVVTAHQVGTATITVSTTDGTNLSASCSVEVVATPAESIALDRTEVTLKANETTTLTATILPETTTNKDVVWSSNDESVATVENGVVTAHQVGTATITATTTDGTNLSASCEVTVVATPAESIALDRTEVTLKANETTTLTATILPETATNKDVEWKSSDESVATVENGVVTAHQVGTATITATTTDGTNLSASCFVEVIATPAASITLDRTEVTLKANETTTLTATILPETTTIKDVEWKSSDESVATVENGVVTAHQVGTATITATTTDGTNLSASCFVEVVATPAESIALDRTEVTLKANETTTLTATILPETATNKDVVWSSNDESVATVENGVVTAHQVGTATITVSTTDGTNLSASCEVKVVATPAESIALDRTEVTLKATETTTLKVTILPKTTTIKNVEWKSSDESVATVENGVVTAQQVGTATITATTTDGTNLSASCFVEVTYTPAQSITLDKSIVMLQATETTTLTATILPETATNKDVEWKSSDESVATVENGVVTAHQVGTATITATTTDGTNLSASCFVEVTYTPAQSITLDKSIVMLQATETTTLTATILPETTTIKDVEWKSSDESVATVENGVVTAHQVGTATITVSTTDGTNLSASCEVKVVATPAESIALDRTEVTLKATETTTLKVTILPKTTTIKNVEWKSSDESVATVENGVVTAQQVGTATITATTTDGTNLSASCFVEVTYTPAQSITLDKSIVMLQATETTTLTATILPETATNKDVEWKSSDESVATVENGVVTAHQVGTATITVSSTDGTNLSASCFVEVVATPAESIALDRTEVTLKANETTTLTATILPETTTIKDVVWSSSDESVATVENGVVTAHKVGTATITATTTDGTNLSASCFVEVTYTPAQSITLDKTSVTLNANETTTLKFTVQPEGTAVRNIVWSSSNDGVATVDDGLVTAHNAGSATISVTATVGDENVWAAYYEGTNWGTSTVYAYVWDAGNGNYQHLGNWPGTPMSRRSDGKWYISLKVDKPMVKPMIIFNNGQGGGSNQTADLTFTNEGVYNYYGLQYDNSVKLSATCDVNVIANDVIAESIALDKTEVTLKATETTTLTATILPETTTIKDVVWSSSDESVATIENGVVTAHKVGTATITVSTTDGTNLSASCEVTVEPTLAEEIVLEPYEIVAIVGDTIELTATIYPKTVTEKAVLWTVSDETVAHIELLSNLCARVVVLREGVATIEVRTIDGTDLTATCTVNIYSHVNKVITDSEEVEYYDLGGLRVAHPSKGIYIVRQGQNVKKVVLK